MGTTTRLLPVVAVTGSSLMVGCGGGGATCGGYGSFGSYGSYGSCAPASSFGAAGIYEGTLTNTANQQRTPVVAIIAEDGEGRMSGQDGTYYHLSVGTMGGNLSGSFQGYSNLTLFPDGTLATSGSISGAATGSAINGTLTDQAGDTQALQLTFDNTYDSGAGLLRLAGTWTYGTTGFSFNATIQSNGTFSATDSTGCTYDGTLSAIDPTYDAYRAAFTRSCAGTSTQFTGLASYFPAAGSGASATPAHIELLADDGAGSYLAAELE